jgi:HEPN domain-containing protein
VDENKRKTVKGWLEKASRYACDAKENAKSGYRVSDAIQAAQQCVELSVKAILTLHDIPYQRNHGWDRKELAEIAKHIQNRGLLNRLAAQNLQFQVPLPRLLFRANFWSQFYLEAKYGIEAGYLAPAQDLFEPADADLAARHADNGLSAAWSILSLPEAQLAALVSP